MRLSDLVPIACSILLLSTAAAPAETLGDPQVGFSAERVLVFDGHSYIGRMWNMPGEQRHEQELPSVKPVFILRADSSIGDVLLPELHTAVEFDLPKVLAVLGQPDILGKPVGRETVNGIATTKYEVDRDIPDGHLSGALWLSRDGIPMRCDGSYANRKGKVSTVHWELRHVQIGEQDAGLFEVPAGYSKLPPEAAATLFGLRLASHPKH
ncbi:MAG TPA: hypothetical protein VMS01_06070 [Stellaceae bacterium]|nr:hypothetical protein [Stellaceae bacterium]